MKKEIIVLLVLLVFLVGCVEESPLTDEELKDLPSDDPALILSEEKALTGQGYSQLTSEKKQAFWNCWRSECQSLLKEAQQTTDYSTYRQCSLDCFDEAQTATDNIWCEDSDGIDYFTKGTVTSNIYTTGKEDECKTFSNGKTYLMEGKCVNDKYQYQQKSCGEVGDDYVCEEGICIEEESCNSIFLSEDNYNKSISLSYCDHLVTSNDMEIRFVNIDGELSLFALREFQGEKYILEYCDFNYDPIFPYMECNLFNIYADGLVVGVNSYDEFSVNLIVTNLCENDHPLCNQVGEDNISQYYSYDSGLFEYYLDPEIIPSEDIKDMYFEIRPQYDQDIFEFLEEYFEISPPVDRIGRIHYLDTSSGSGAPGFFIKTRTNQVLTEQKVLGFGPSEFQEVANPHEMVHVFLSGIPVNQGWLEEGLADYMNKVNGVEAFNCYEDGWANHGCSIPTPEGACEGDLVPYSDFTIKPDYYAPFGSPLKRSSYYTSAYCFWDYIYANYGSEGIKSIVKKWHDSRKELPTYKKWLVKDVVNPALGENLSSLIYERYSYIEG